ncbi:protein-tyrosine-phosphatase [Pseudomonas aeruginosa]|nr:protein-tyrosine-phosphatase [Pseudomonas aeruginosa]
MTDRLRVLFVCIANDARSLIAEAILRHTDGEHFAAFSAGVRPAGVDPRTLSVLEHAGIPTQGLSSKPLETFAGESFDYLIDLCDKDTDELAQLPHSAQTLAWSCSDPTLPGRPGRIQPCPAGAERPGPAVPGSEEPPPMGNAPEPRHQRRPSRRASRRPASPDR